MKSCAIVPAAGQGRRMGQDKALVDLGGLSAIERIAETCRQAGIDRVVIARSAGAAPLPPLGEGVTAVEVPPGGEMLASVRAGLQAAGESEALLVFPVDHALVTADTVCGLLGRLGSGGAGIVLPLYRDRPGHPAAFAGGLAAEILAPETESLREVVRRDPARVAVLPTANPWVVRDLDRPEDLRAARAALLGSDLPVTEQMHRHRSRRAYHPDPVPDEQIERLVDAARHASTSSLIQAYSVVAVAAAERRAAIAALCGNQRHIHQAPVFLAICGDAHKLDLACRQHGAELQTRALELFVQVAVDAALLGQNLQLAAESEGLGSCMIGAARNHPRELAALLGLPPCSFVLFGMVLGRPADDPVPRGRMPLPGVLHRERYDESVLAACLAEADEQMQKWAREVNASGKQLGGRPVDESKGWTDRMAAAWGRDSRYLRERLHLREELRALGFALE